MKKELKLIDVINIYENVQKFNLSELSGSEKYEVMKLLRSFKSVSDEFNNFKEDVISKYRDSDEFKSYQGKETDESKEYFDKINKEINDILILEIQQNKELEFNPISKDMFIKIMDKTNIPINDALLLEEQITSNND